MGTSEVNRVLFIDDEEILARMAARILRTDFSVTAVSDSRLALELLSVPDASFDVIFCDLAMPFMSGPELYRSVLERNPALARRIVFVTGGTTDELDQFLRSIPNECLEKPFDPEELRRVAHRLSTQMRPSGSTQMRPSGSTKSA